MSLLKGNHGYILSLVQCYSNTTKQTPSKYKDWNNSHALFLQAPGWAGYFIHLSTGDCSQLAQASVCVQLIHYLALYDLGCIHLRLLSSPVCRPVQVWSHDGSRGPKGKLTSENTSLSLSYVKFVIIQLTTVRVISRI